jgi:hypothetical protein
MLLQEGVADESPTVDCGSTFTIHSAGEIAKQGQRVLVASFADHGRRPEPGPDIDHGKDPDGLFLAPDDRFDLV